MAAAAAAARVDFGDAPSPGGGRRDVLLLPSEVPEGGRKGQRPRPSWMAPSPRASPASREEDVVLPLDSKRTGKKRTTFTSTLLEHLLPETERAQECANEEIEQAERGGDLSTSYKSFAKGKKFQLCKRRAAFWHDKDFRVLDRAAPFGQSKGHWLISTVTSKSEGSEETKVAFRQLVGGDMFHLILNAPTYFQLLGFLVISMLLLTFFALLFLWAEEDCGLKLDYSFTKAYMLSVETMMTVGYGVSDPYMQGCWQGPLIITSQSLLHMLNGACLIGIIFQGLSRPQARANMILFSEKAVIRSIDGSHYLVFRIWDLRIQHAIIEPHVRCYCFRRSEDQGQRFEMAPMRLHQPDDSFGAALDPSLPTVVMHRIDAQSPLAPKRKAEAPRLSGRLSDSSAGDVSPRSSVASVGLQRQAAVEVGSDGACACPTCGESFDAPGKLQAHCHYLSHRDPAMGLPPAACHAALTEEQMGKLQPPPEPSREEIEEHLAQNFFEVVALVEGTEPTTASTLQARHSYVVGGGAGDLAWDMAFANCCTVRADSSHGLVLDLRRFHTLEPLEPAGAAAEKLEG